MSLSDPIADMLTRIRNASSAGHPRVTMAGSRLKVSILEILKNEGFIEDFAVKKESKKTELEVTLKYMDKAPVIRQLERVSSPGRRFYIKAKEVKPVRNHLGLSILSTPKGVMTGRQARSQNVGGELICRVW
ncbi:MAG: 30S ribosomal protein S8 [Leptospirales bacterium]|nr:30S ribosomal protein S8 [Leptospirales bacterium]